MKSIAKRRLRCLDDYGDFSRGNDEEKRRGGADDKRAAILQGPMYFGGKASICGYEGKKEIATTNLPRPNREVGP